MIIKMVLPEQDAPVEEGFIEAQTLYLKVLGAIQNPYSKRYLVNLWYVMGEKEEVSQIKAFYNVEESVLHVVWVTDDSCSQDYKFKVDTVEYLSDFPLI
jgi:hypothetical protein